MPIRVAARAVIVENQRLLLVNAFPDQKSDLWCAPGGGAQMGESLTDSLKREVYEETGLKIGVDRPCLVNEFHQPDSAFHQIDVFFRCHIESGTIDDQWRDPEGIVTDRRFFTKTEISGIRLKPDSLVDIAFSDGFGYDPLELLVT